MHELVFFLFFKLSSWQKNLYWPHYPLFRSQVWEKPQGSLYFSASLRSGKSKYRCFNWSPAFHPALPFFPLSSPKITATVPSHPKACFCTQPHMKKSFKDMKRQSHIEHRWEYSKKCACFLWWYAIMCHVPFSCQYSASQLHKSNCLVWRNNWANHTARLTIQDLLPMINLSEGGKQKWLFPNVVNIVSNSWNSNTNCSSIQRIFEEVSI